MVGKECVGGLNSVFVNFTGTNDQLKKYFPKLVEVETFNQMTNVSTRGVYVLKDKDTLRVRIFGGCPNYTNGECRLKGGCASIVE